MLILASQAELYLKPSFDFLNAESKQGLQYASIVNMANLSRISKYRAELVQFAAPATVEPGVRPVRYRAALS